MSEDAASLKRLKFVKSYTTYIHSATELAEKVYKTTRSFTPAVAEPYFATVEDRVAAYAAPVVTTVQDQADKALRTFDTQLDASITKLWNSYDDGRSFVTKQAHFIQSTQSKVQETTKEAYLKAVEQSLSVVTKQRSALCKAAQTTVDALQARIESARSATEKGTELARSATEKGTELALTKVIDTWNYLLTFPAVSKILDTSSPALQLAAKYYVAAHDLVVADPKYKVAFEFSSAFIDKLQSSSMYKKGQDIVYPVIAPVANPVLKMVTGSPYYTTVIEQLKPVQKVS